MLAFEINKGYYKIGNILFDEYSLEPEVLQKFGYRKILNLGDDLHFNIIVHAVFGKYDLNKNNGYQFIIEIVIADGEIEEYIAIKTLPSLLNFLQQTSNISITSLLTKRISEVFPA